MRKRSLLIGQAYLILIFWKKWSSDRFLSGLNTKAGALGETEALLAAILHLADDHPALGQILEMSEG
jgi:hypothetical protein